MTGTTTETGGTHVTFRASELMPQLTKRGKVIGRVAKRDLGRYYWLLELAWEKWLVERRVDAGTWQALSQFINSHYWDAEELEDGRSFVQEAERWLKSPVGRLYDNAVAALMIDAITDLKPDQLLAMIDVAEVQWYEQQQATTAATAGATSVA